MATRPEEITEETRLAIITRLVEPDDFRTGTLPVFSHEVGEAITYALNLHLNPTQHQVAAHQGRFLEHPTTLMITMAKEVFAILQQGYYESTYTPFINWIRSTTHGDKKMENTYVAATALVLRFCQRQIGPSFWDKLGSFTPKDLLGALQRITTSPQRSEDQPISIIDEIDGGQVNKALPPPWQNELRACLAKAYDFLPSPYDNAFVLAAASVYTAIEDLMTTPRKSN